MQQELLFYVKQKYQTCEIKFPKLDSLDHG